MIDPRYYTRATIREFIATAPAALLEAVATDGGDEFECPTCHEEHVLFPGREWAT